MIQVPNSSMAQVFSFVRREEREDDKVFVVINFSDVPAAVTFEESLHLGTLQHWKRNQKTTFSSDTALTLNPWGFEIWHT